MIGELCWDICARDKLNVVESMDIELGKFLNQVWVLDDLRNSLASALLVTPKIFMRYEYLSALSTKDEIW